MLIDRHIYAGADGNLLGGLVWRPAAGGKPSRSALKKAVALSDATHQVTLTTPGGVMYGLWQARPSEDGLELPRHAMSAAALFALKVGREHPDAILVTHAEGPDGERRYVVVLDGGLPSIDTLLAPSEVARLLQDSGGPVFGNDLVAFPTATATELRDLVAQSRTALVAARVKPLPVNPLPLLALAALAAGLLVGYSAWHRHERAQAQANLEAEAAASDPRPRYLALLASQRAAMTTDRQQIIAMVRQFDDLPAILPGWQLRQVECVASQRECTAMWLRRGGTYDELRAAVPRQALMLEGEAAGALDRAVTTWPVHVERRGIEQPLPRLATAALVGGNLWQDWRTAGMGVEMLRPVLWPLMPELPPDFRDAGAVRRGELVVTGIPAVLAEELLSGAPAWVSWERVQLDFSDVTARPTATQLQINLRGAYYVADTL